MDSILTEIEWLEGQPAPFIAIGNKADRSTEFHIKDFEELPDTLAISAFDDSDLVKNENGLSNIIFASTHNVYGKSMYLPIDEEHPTESISSYGISKLIAEKICKMYYSIILQSF